MKHALVIGGTGMLSGLSLWLAENNYYVSVVARDPHKMERMIKRSANPSKLMPIFVDYSHEDEWRRALLPPIRQKRPFDLVVAWIHSYANSALYTVAEIVSKNNNRWQLYHLLGSNRDADAVKASLGIPDNCDYHQVQLGFVIENNRSRWLTNDEISAGTIATIRNRNDNYTLIGESGPWHRWPGNV
ncbi:short-chain dehydrogenase [Bacillus badius]|uniref:short-chain dehydrogenase n=1 Tax=Bacillus badius TaxID=1455 RepID=UPI002E1BC2EB|nr:short-chain dehydrogenase [Bacillus badius]